MGVMKIRHALLVPLLTVLILSLSHCASTPTDHYRSQIEPLLGKGTKAQVNALFGEPALCHAQSGVETCEYRVVRSLADAKTCPNILDSRPQDTFHAYFNESGTLKDWQPLNIQP
jgi:hypothetical protein